MDRLGRVAEEVLDRHPAPALPFEELSALVAREAPGGTDAETTDAETLLRAIREDAPDLRVVEGDRERLGAAGPSRWVVAPAGSRRGKVSGRSLGGRLRESLRTLGASLEPGSNLALARWARLLYEEERVRRVIARPAPPADPVCRTRWVPPGGRRGR